MERFEHLFTLARIADTRGRAPTAKSRPFWLTDPVPSGIILGHAIEQR
jgi:hypothetical protein